MDKKKAVVSCKPTLAEMYSNSPSSASSYEFLQNWSHQEPVTEDYFTYSRLGPGSGQVDRTG